MHTKQRNAKKKTNKKNRKKSNQLLCKVAAREPKRLSAHCEPGRSFEFHDAIFISFLFREANTR